MKKRDKVKPATQKHYSQKMMRAAEERAARTGEPVDVALVRLRALSLRRKLD